MFISFKRAKQLLVKRKIAILKLETWNGNPKLQQ
jgi:hypothetical protein